MTFAEELGSREEEHDQAIADLTQAIRYEPHNDEIYLLPRQGLVQEG